MTSYCKRCGKIIERPLSEETFICDYCKSVTFIVPSQYTPDGLDFPMREKQKIALIEEQVKPSPYFNEYDFNHRQKIQRAQSQICCCSIQKALPIKGGFLEVKNYRMVCCITYCQPHYSSIPNGF